MNYASITELLGKTIVEINNSNTLIDFRCNDGTLFQMYHDQDCCETVTIEDIIGDLNDLLNSPILEAEEVVSTDMPEGFAPEYAPESFTWTFYKLGTIKGHVTIRWYGESNGYYSESVNVFKVEPQPAE